MAHKLKSEPLPKWLVLTPKRLKKVKEQQQLLRAEAESRGRLSPEARHLQLGVAHETSARADVLMLESEGADVRTSEPLRLARTRLADALAHQGRYDEAAAAAPDEARQKEYFDLWHAVWAADDATCPCEPLDPQLTDGLTLTHDHVALEVISQKHQNKLMPAIKCNCCGFINVRSLPHELQQLQKVRERSQALLHGRRPEDLLHQAKEILAHLSDQKAGR